MNISGGLKISYNFDHTLGNLEIEENLYIDRLYTCNHHNKNCGNTINAISVKGNLIVDNFFVCSKILSLNGNEVKGIISNRISLPWKLNVLGAFEYNNLSPCNYLDGGINRDNEVNIIENKLNNLNFH